MLWSAIRSAPKPGVSLFSGTDTDTILPLPSTAISTLNGAKPVTSYMVGSTAAFSATVGSAAGSATVGSTAGSATVGSAAGSAVASTVGSATTVTPFAIAACFSAALMALLVSVTPLFTSICAVAMS